MHHVTVLAALVFLGLALESNGQPPASVSAQTTIRDDAPLDVQTVYSAKTEARGSATFNVNAAAFGSEQMLGQRDAESNVIRFIASLSESDARGKTVDLAVAPTDVEPRVTIELREGGFQFLDDGRPVLFYRQQPKSLEGKHARANYVHPLLSLDGTVLTQEFPSDHRHHHGVFWAWHQLLVGDVRAGDPWLTQDFLAIVKNAQVIEQGPVFASLRIVANWTSPKIADEQDQERPIVEETTMLRLYRAFDDAQYVDFEIRLLALLDGVRIGGADNARGYSGFTVRVKPPEKMRIRDANQDYDKDAIGSRSPWADVSGKFDGGDQVSGIAILGHASLPEFPSRWLLRHYGMQNVVYPGRHPITLSAEQPLVLRHRLVIHRGNSVEARIADHQTAYENAP